MKLIVLPLCFMAVLLPSCSDNYYSETDFSDVRKVDSHIHIRSDDGAFEDQAASDNFVLISLGVDHGDPENIREQQNFAAASAIKYPGKVFFGPTFFFDTAGWGTAKWSSTIIDQLEKDLSEPGTVAVKIWKNVGMTVRDSAGKFIMADDPGLTPVINFIISKNIPIAGHLGEPKNCWLPLDQMTVSSDSGYFSRNPQYHMYLHPEYPSYEDQIRARDRLVEMHPDLVFIGCHLGSLEWNVDSLALRLDRYPNMAVDISARICHLQYQSAKDVKRVRDFCIKYQDRLLYGTDVTYNGSNNPDAFKKRMHETWIDDWKYLTSDDEMTSSKFRGTFKGLKLPRSVVDKIYYGNAVKWYKLAI